MNFRKYGIFVGLIAGSVSCTLGPDYRRPDVGLPEKFQEVTVQGESIATLDWWAIFKDPNLQKLVRIALEENKDLAVAVARIEEARARLGFTKADQFPRIDASGNASRTEVSKEILSSEYQFNDFGLFADLSFELDLWGKLRKATEAQREQLFATEYARRVVVLSLISNVSSLYISLGSLDRRLQIARRTLENRRKSTELITIRFKGGIVPELDVNQADFEEQDAAIAVAQLERAIRQTENALSVLLGRAPFTITRELQGDEQYTPIQIPSGVPAQLLKRRPDILAAESFAKSEIARVGVAKAEQLPSFNLIGFIGLQSSEISDLLDARAATWGIGGTFLGPLLDFGKSRSRVEIAEARVEQAYKSYEQTVLSAVQEVEDALIAIRTFESENQARIIQVKAGQNAARLSRARYDDGIVPYLEVLDIESRLFEAELAASETREQYLVSIVQLFKALGGGWSEQSAQSEQQAQTNPSS